MSHEVHSGDVSEGLRGAAVQALALHCERIDSESVWRDLVAGTVCVVDEFFTSEGSFLILSRPSATGGALSGRNLDILEEVLLGADQKVVAIERNLAQSTVAACLRQACGKIGLSCKPSRVSLFVVTLVHAAKGRGRIESGGTCELEYEGVKYRALSMARPNRVFDRVLSPSEEAVVRMRVEGRSHAEIAADRKTSLRTVANQVAAAFQRLGISSRSDLIELLILPGNPSPLAAREPRPRRPPSFPGRAGRGSTNRPGSASVSHRSALLRLESQNIKQRGPNLGPATQR
jgi:DNA-binding NarL/FixJ family response regulator